MNMCNTRQNFPSRVGSFLLLLLFLLGVSGTATTLTAALPIECQIGWMTVIENYADAYPTVDVQWIECPPWDLRQTITAECTRATGVLDVVMIHRAWVSDLAYCLQDLSRSVGKLVSAGSVPVLCDGKVLGGQWPNNSDWVVCVSKQSKNLDHAVALLLAATQTVTPSIKFLTQNTMLLPSVSEVIPQRVPCIIDLISGYHIIGLQEVFEEDSQNRILKTWHDALPGKPNWHPLDDTDDVDDLAEEEKPRWGVKVIDVRPDKGVEAELVCGPYYVMGPDQGFLDTDQDGGLVILSKYPIIITSAFVYSESTGWDRYANKGAIYARIQVGSSREEYIHVFNTHLQAHNKSADKKIRVKQIEELQMFIRKAIGIGQDPEKPDKHPIIVLGDFNIIAADSEYQMLHNNLLTLGESDWLLDAWTTIYHRFPQPDYTWIGMSDKPTSDERSPYGTLGNTLADEKDKRQRIDYIFYYRGGGTAEVALNPQSILLVPFGASDTRILYCFDKDHWGETCDKIYTKGGDLEGRALWALDFYFKIADRGMSSGTSIPQWLRDEFDRRARDWEEQFSSLSPSRLSENATIRQMEGEDRGRRRTYWLICDGIKVYIIRKNEVKNQIYVHRCLFSSHTISDHLGLEMRCEIVFLKQ